MKRVIIFVLIAAACLGVSWGAYQVATSPPEPALSRYFPSGALLYSKRRISPRFFRAGTILLRIACG